jgi:hypothetical protein
MPVSKIFKILLVLLVAILITSCNNSKYSVKHYDAYEYKTSKTSKIKKYYYKSLVYSETGICKLHNKKYGQEGRLYNVDRIDILRSFDDNDNISQLYYVLPDKNIYKGLPEIIFSDNTLMIIFKEENIYYVSYIFNTISEYTNAKIAMKKLLELN